MSVQRDARERAQRLNGVAQVQAYRVTPGKRTNITAEKYTTWRPQKGDAECERYYRCTCDHVDGTRVHVFSDPQRQLFYTVPVSIISKGEIHGNPS